jgi:6-pyruvoyltetrahydropterin/6-carboxytetrahydropterin synthase
MSITIRHNVEMAHRLFLTEGKCQNIHGHSWLVALSLQGQVDSTGKLGGVEFGDAKHIFRHYLNTTYDHRLLLNADDPWALVRTAHSDFSKDLPGLQVLDGDPTTENFAQTIGIWASATFKLPVQVQVKETAVNMAQWPSGGFYLPTGEV